MTTFRSKWRSWVPSTETDETDKTADHCSIPGSVGSVGIDALGPKNEPTLVGTNESVQTDAGSLRAFRIVNDCRRVAPFIAQRLGIDLRIPLPVPPYPSFEHERFTTFVDGCTNAQLSDNFQEIRSDFESASIGSFNEDETYRLAVTALAGELGARSGIFQWPLACARRAVIEYAETVHHVMLTHLAEAKEIARIRRAQFEGGHGPSNEGSDGI